jgi:hypothetical protein
MWTMVSKLVSVLQAMHIRLNSFEFLERNFRLDASTFVDDHVT